MCFTIATHLAGASNGSKGDRRDHDPMTALNTSGVGIIEIFPVSYNSPIFVNTASAWYLFKKYYL
jgi:hypothetical protein